jgi:eukaryotic-like serine/threonine-protein kinase
MPGDHDSVERRYVKTILWVCIGMVLVVAIGAVTAFLMTVRSEEQTMVPDVIGQELASALIDLQEKHLIPNITLRFSSDPSDKGTILGQDPVPGTLVKADARVVLIVSKGSAIERIEEYIGWYIYDLENHLKTLVNVYGATLSIKKPVIRVFDDSEPGTVLEQKPLPGTEITGRTELELVVSRGPEGRTMIVKDYIGMPFEEVLADLIMTQVYFVFTSRIAEDPETDVPGTVLAQNPEAETEVPADMLLQLVIAEPEDLPEGYVFGILEKTLDDYPVPVDLEIEAIDLTGRRQERYTIRHPGGLLTLPYLEEEGTILVISVSGTELLRFTVRGKTE